MSEEAFDLAINRFKLRIYAELCLIAISLGAMIFGMGDMWSLRFLAAVLVCAGIYALCNDLISLFVLNELIGNTNVLEETAKELEIWDEQNENTPE